MNVLLPLLSKLKHDPRTAGVRKFTNLLYYDPEWVNIKLQNYDIVEVDGCRFHVTDQINSIQRVKGNSWFGGVKETDVVVDIGANIGAIAIPLAKTARKVYAVEPLFYRELKKNIKLNGLDNIEVTPAGIGRKRRETIGFSSKVANVTVIPFSELKRRVGRQIDFLKMDGEGCEWDIAPSELKGIRELRIEFHIPRGKTREYGRKYEEYLDWMRSEGYEVEITDIDVGPNPYYSESPEVRASLCIE